MRQTDRCQTDRRQTASLNASAPWGRRHNMKPVLLMRAIIRLLLASCRREAATICPRPGLQVVTRYTSYTHMDRSLNRCPCLPAITANQTGLVTLTFDLESGVRVTCDVGYLCANFSHPGPLCSRARPDVRDRQRDVRPKHSLMPAYYGRVHNNRIYI